MATSSYGCLSRAATLHSVDPSQHKSNLKITLVVCFHSKDFYISIFTLRPHYLHDDDDKITLKHSKEMTTSQKFNDNQIFFHFEAFSSPNLLNRGEQITLTDWDRFTIHLWSVHLHHLPLNLKFYKHFFSSFYIAFNTSSHVASCTPP